MMPLSERQPVRVAQLIESDGPGGAERVVVDLACALQASGCSSIVFVPARGEGWLERQLAGSDVTIEHFELNAPFSPACARRLAAAFRRHRVSVAHSHEFSMAVYGGWASWLAGVPHVITMHGSRYYAGRLRRRVALRAAVAASSRTVAVSRQLAGHLSRDLLIARRQIDVIPNGVRFTPNGETMVRQELGLTGADRLIVSIGNLYPVKGHRHLIDAIARLMSRHPTLHLAIAGRGDLGDALTRQAHAAGLGARVHLLGLRSDIAAVLAAADLFVLPSLSEGLPLALLEAMLAGLPIVASDVGEIRATLADGGAGVLVEPANPAALADALHGLLIDPARARLLAGRARALASEYDITQMARRYSSTYFTALGRRRSLHADLSYEIVRPL